MYVENRATKEAERVKHVSKKEHYECMSNEFISLVGMFKANVSHLKGSCEGFT